MTKTDEAVEKELLTRYGVSAARLKELADFVNTIGEFAQYLGANQYYSDVVNKKIALLNVDAQAAALEVEELIVRVGALRDSVKKSVLTKKKIFPATTGLEEKIAGFEKKVLELNERALALTRELRCEFGKKGFTASV
ncbi:MAG: hypothetical protein QW343_00715 [Candidatus Norongarragalinales archaeon]